MSASAAEVKPLALVTRVGIEVHVAPVSSLANVETIEEVRSAVASSVDARATKVVIDLSAAKRINSAGLEMMLDLHDQLMRVGGSLKVKGSNAVIRQVFRITEFDRHVAIICRQGEDKPEAAAETIAQTAPLGERLVARGMITEDQIDKALQLQAKTGKRLGLILTEQGWVTEQDLQIVLSDQLALPFVRLAVGFYDPEVAVELDKIVARRLVVFPLFKVRGVVFVATANPQDMPSLAEVEERLGCSAQPVVACREDILKAISENLSNDEFANDLIIDEADGDLELVENLALDDHAEIDDLAAGSPVINLVNSLIQRAVRDGASDIHIEPGRKQSRVRFRIDGILYEVMTPRIELHPALISRLKVMANLDIAERRLPQDGRIQVLTQQRSVDLRFSSLPGLYGEKVVLRVLDKSQAILNIKKLGMSGENLDAYTGLLRHSFGLILVTGPTGSGKTTSLYAALNHLNSLEKNIVTIEDPVEYQIDIINQNEVKERIGLTFAKVLKHVLRQDPDIVMVGEIRERETASIAVQAALTGHLVLSTLHTNDSAGAITRMIDMGVEPYLLSSALIGVVAQRLVRSICPSCKTSYQAPPEIATRYGWPKQKVQLARGRGCSQCYDSGYLGRMGVHEVLEADAELQRLIISNPSRDQLTEFMDRRGKKSLFQDGLERVREGKTTIEEVSRVINA